MESGTQEKLLSLMLLVLFVSPPTTEHPLELRQRERSQEDTWHYSYLLSTPPISVSESIVMEVVSPAVSGSEVAGNCMRMV